MQVHIAQKNAIFFYESHFSLAHLTKKYFKTIDIDGERGIMTTVIAKGPTQRNPFPTNAPAQTKPVVSYFPKVIYWKDDLSWVQYGHLAM